MEESFVVWAFYMDHSEQPFTDKFYKKSNIKLSKKIRILKKSHLRKKKV